MALYGRLPGKKPLDEKAKEGMRSNFTKKLASFPNVNWAKDMK